MTRERVEAKLRAQHQRRVRPALGEWVEAELDELVHLAGLLRADFPQAGPFTQDWDRQCALLLRNRSATAMRAEMALDDLATQLRKICLHVANLHAISVYRSPPDHEMPRTSEEHPIDFGYERDIHPVELEKRAAARAISASGWSGRHLLFSSGQSALQAILLAVRRLVGVRDRCSLLHLGSYFETRELITLLAGAGLFDVLPQDRFDDRCEKGADIVIHEPVQCTPEGQRVEKDQHQRFRDACQLQAPKAIILDSTLCRQRFDYLQILKEARQLDPVPVVIVFRSGLKLDQAGLELANVGIVTLLGEAGRKRNTASAVAAELGRFRTLTGSGLRFEDINALSVPWFLGPGSAAYADRVFVNNAQVAAQFDLERGLTLSHPWRQDRQQVAPFSLLQMPGQGNAAYQRLEDLIDKEARRRDILLQRGGSFGFRGHRFQAIIPTHGSPFIRLAMGSRRDRSHDRIIEMLNDFPEWIVNHTLSC